MKNITVTLDEETARRARLRAAEKDMSVSRYIGELVNRDISASDEYQDALRRYLASDLVVRRQPGERRVAREASHDRAALRQK